MTHRVLRMYNLAWVSCHAIYHIGMILQSSMGFSRLACSTLWGVMSVGLKGLFIIWRLTFSMLCCSLSSHIISVSNWKASKSMTETLENNNAKKRVTQSAENWMSRTIDFLPLISISLPLIGVQYYYLRTRIWLLCKQTQSLFFFLPPSHYRILLAHFKERKGSHPKMH